MMFLQLLFVAFMMPETKGISLELLSKNLTKRRKITTDTFIGNDDQKANFGTKKNNKK
jgi:hypothetical protein